MERAVSAQPALAFLLGYRVQRVDGPRPGLLALTLYERGEKLTLLIAFAANQRGIGARRERPKGDAASAFVQRLRTQIEGARVREIDAFVADAGALALRLGFERADHRVRIVADFDSRAPNLFLLRQDDTVAGAADERARRARFSDKSQRYTPSQGKGIAIPDDPAALEGAGAALVDEGETKADDRLRQAARTQVRAALKKAERKVSAIEGDLARAAETPRLRREANLLLCSLDRVSRGANSVRLLDESVEPAEWVEISLDPAIDVRRAAEQRFERARRIERGLAIASERLALARGEADRLRQLDAHIEAADSEQLDALSVELGLRSGPGARVRQKPRARTPFRTFFGAHGEPIFVGKGAADNDTLTLTVARPHDAWMHVRGSAGSHVVVPLERKAALAPELLLDAAHLAAHFSQQRGEPTVEIAHTERRFVRKLRGSAPGSVNVDRERVLLLRVEPARLARLLATERS